MIRHILILIIFLSLAMVLFARRSRAQYIPIPDGNGAAVLNGINARFSGAQPITPTMEVRDVTVTYALSPYTVNATTANFIRCDATSGNVTIDLPAATGTGTEIQFKRLDSSSNTCTITANGTDKIDGLSTFTLGSQYENIALIDSANAAWDIRSSVAALTTTGNASIGGSLSVTGGAAINTAQTSQNGTSGTASCVQAMTGTALKIVSCYLNAYTETGTAQTFAFPTAFSATPVLLESGGSCGAYNPTVTGTVLTLPANASMTAETCNVIMLGQ